MNDIIIARSELTDADEMSIIEEASFSDPWSKESIKSAISSEHLICLCAKDGDVTAGYGFAGVAADECEILNIAVAKDYRRRGVASSLMSGMLSESSRAGARTAYLEVRRSNTAAMTLYEKFGFVTIGERKNYYKYPTEDALIMAAELSPEGDIDDNFCD